MNNCPDSKMLASYVSGSLNEETAFGISHHLDLCPTCQKRADVLANEGDTLVDALRWRMSNAEANTEEDTVNRLIAKAQVQAVPPQRPAADPQVAKPGPGAETSADDVIALDVFVTCLHKSRLMHSSEIELLAERIEPADSNSFAKELVARGKLTHFQATALKRGKYKGLVLGNYVVLEKLGQGGMGHVFLARHKKMGRHVCLKVLRSGGRKSPEIVERFRREARTVAALNHPNIVVAHDADEEGGIHFLVMEYVQGSDLAKVIERQGPLRGDQAVGLILQSARALEYAHREGVVHRDIKPHNLLLDETGAIKILDMGLARFDSYLSESSDASSYQTMTSTGVVMGTVDYMSPEQALNSQGVDHRSDIYSLGCTLHFLITGQSLFGQGTVMERLIAHREQPIPQFDENREDIPLGLEAVFRRMVAKDQDQRYQSMSDLAVDLEAVMSGDTPSAQKQDTLESSFRAFRKWGAWVAVILFLVMFSASVFRLAQWELGYIKSIALSSPPQQTTPRSGLPTAKTPPKTNKSKPAVSAPRRPKRPIRQTRPTKTVQQKRPAKAVEVMVVVPHKGYLRVDYENVVQELSSRKVQVKTASSKSRQHAAAIDKKGRRSKGVWIDVPLHKFDPGKFDGLIFCSGDVKEFLYEGSASKTAENAIRRCLEKGKTVVSIGNARDVIYHSDQAPGVDFGRSNYLGLMRKNRPGFIIVAPGPQSSKRLVNDLLRHCCRP